MATNYIEEFFIGIGFDTKRVKKEAKEIDNLLDSLVSKKRKQVSAETKASKEKAKVEARIHKTTKASDADNAKHFIKQEKAKQIAIAKTNAARVRQAVSRITAHSGASRARDSASVFQRNFNLQEEAKKAESIKDTAARERYIARQQRRAKLKQDRLKEEHKANAIAMAGLKQRLAIYKREKRARLGAAAREADWSRRGEAIRSSPTYQNLPEDRRARISPRINQAVTRRDIHALRALRTEVNSVGREFSRTTRLMNNQGVVQRGLTDSTRNMIRSYASVFALFQGTVAIKRIGQDFQGMSASMLAASGSANAAAEEMVFISRIVDNMGLSLKDTTDAYVKFKFAAKGKMEQTDIEALFENLSMFGTALKVAPEDMKRSHKALAQMMSKGKIMSEELKLQLGDALPGAVQVFARALKMTEAELFKQMEQGKLVASEVLPKVAAEYKKAAMEGGAYAQALEGLRVTEGRLATDSQRAAKKIFDGNFEKGLSGFYTTLSESLKDSEESLKSLGRGFGLFFKGLSKLIQGITPVLNMFARNMDALFGAAALTAIGTMTAAFAGFGNVAAIAWAKALAPVVLWLAAVTAVVAAIDEVRGTFDMNIMSGKEKKQGYQERFEWDGLNSGFKKYKITQGQDGKYYSEMPEAWKAKVGAATPFQSLPSPYDPSKTLNITVNANAASATEVATMVTGQVNDMFNGGYAGVTK